MVTGIFATSIGLEICPEGFLRMKNGKYCFLQVLSYFGYHFIIATENNTVIHYHEGRRT